MYGAPEFTLSSSFSGRPTSRPRRAAAPQSCSEPARRLLRRALWAALSEAHGADVRAGAPGLTRLAAGLLSLGRPRRGRNTCAARRHRRVGTVCAMRAIRFDGAGGHEVIASRSGRSRARHGRGARPRELRRAESGRPVAARRPLPGAARRAAGHPRPRGLRHRRGLRRAVHGWQAGDRVFGLVGGGGLAEPRRGARARVARVPDGSTTRSPRRCRRRSSRRTTPSSSQAAWRWARRCWCTAPRAASAARRAARPGARARGCSARRARDDARGAGRRARRRAGRRRRLRRGRARAHGRARRRRDPRARRRTALPRQPRRARPRGAHHDRRRRRRPRSRSSLGALMGARGMRGTVLRARPLRRRRRAVRAFEREVVPHWPAGACARDRRVSPSTSASRPSTGSPPAASAARCWSRSEGGG